ncbi:hypothetical protein G1K66_12280 [Tenacibaculum finnmarkense]|uniref:hypothetical protein n=1 Tax=Tenacibaculum finnmarkense TaxID=2781243 RepID=UPI001E35CCDA|nr:hypothetical protein [Tenacibaculum finnmarkense]MCD8401371.1 hypothetical protein [Tenacibaculum finnmarkense genomovar ulcerans]MCG8786447.1 hypothetical protein [Tenacibaculum finnmarkense]MCG8814033.1 hypothetical protein [Tenacibaculum finnmarkense]
MENTEFKIILHNTYSDKEFTKKEDELKEELNAVIDKWSKKGFSPIFEFNKRESGFMINRIKKVQFLNREQRILGKGGEEVVLD